MKYRDSAPFLRMLGGAGASELRSAARAPEDSWESIDNTVYEAMRGVMNFSASLPEVSTQNGIGDRTHQLNNLGTLDAYVSMDMDQNEVNRVQFEAQTVPCPGIASDFTVSIRDRAAGASTMISVDGVSLNAAGMGFGVALERLSLEARVRQYDGVRLYSATTHPNRITLTGNDGISTAADNDARHRRMLNAAAELRGRGYPGPFDIYFGSNYEPDLDTRFGEGDSTTLREMLSRTFGMVAVSYHLPAAHALVKQMGVLGGVRIVGQAPSSVQWTATSPLSTDYKVFGVVVPGFPEVQYDTGKGSGTSIGIAHLS